MEVGFLRYEPQRFDQYLAIGRSDSNNWSMGAQEALFICSLLAATRARRVIEIGTNIGHSALYMCHALRAVGFPDATFHSFEMTDRAEIARRHLAQFGYDTFAHVHQASSTGAEAEAVRKEMTPIDAILIDGDHSFEGSYADFRFWSPALRPGGILFFHDISEEFEQTYLKMGLHSVYTTIQTIEKDHPGYSIIRMIPPHYHNVTSMAIVQKTC